MTLKVGNSYSHQFEFSQEEVNAFAKISGDDNPLHLDETYARTTIFKKPIIHGFLSGSIISMILGTKFPGPGTIYLKQEMKFLSPMYVDNQYICEVKIVETNPIKKRLLLETNIKDVNNNYSLKGTATVMNERLSF